MTRSESHNWTIPDLIDFELWVREESDVPESEKTARRIANLELCSATGSQSRRELFWRWVHAKRARRHPHSESPGSIAYAWFRASSVMSGLLGVILGFSVVAGFFSGFLSGSGKAEPVNVVAFAGVCILLPALFTGGSLLVWLCKSSWKTAIVPQTCLRSLLWLLTSPALERLLRRTADSLNSQTQLKTANLMGNLKALLVSRRSLLTSYFTAWSQAFGAGYAIALPVAILWQNATTSQDYNWQTNLDEAITPERFHSLVHGVAIPWAWWQGEGEGFPSLDQVRATEYVKYSPTTPESADAWGTWAAFLLLASTAYVTLPRLSLYAVASAAVRRQLRREPFDEARFDELAESLTIPVTAWSAQHPTKPIASGEEADSGPPVQEAECSCVILVPQDLFPDVAQAVQAHLRKSRGWQVLETLPLPSGTEECHELLESLPSFISPSGSTRFTLVEDAGSPPVFSQISRLHTIRERLGSNVGIVVALLGPSSGNPLGDPPRSSDLVAWQRRIQAMGDPNIRILSLHSDSS